MARKSPKPFEYDVFVLRHSGEICWECLPDRSVFAAYELLPRGTGSRLFKTKGIEGLRKAMSSYAARGRVPNEVLVLAADRVEDLPDIARNEVLRAVLLGIESLKKRRDKEALKKVRRALERKGTKRGVKASPENYRWLIDLLAKLATEPKRLFKQLVPRPWKPGSANARLSSFCWDFYQDCVLLEHEDPVSWLEPRTAKRPGEVYGFRFLDQKYADHDLLAAQEAYRRGKEQLPDST